MYLKAHIPTGAGPAAIVLLCKHYLNVGVICNPLLVKQYQQLAEQLRREYQIGMRIYTRVEYHNDEVETDIQRSIDGDVDDDGKEIPIFDAFFIDERPDALQDRHGSYPKVPMLVHMEELFTMHKITMIVL